VPPARPRTPRWLEAIAWATRTRARSVVAIAVALLPVAALVVLGAPRAGDALVALRPKALAPLAVQDDIERLFGGRPGQWIVLSIDRDADRAAARADAIADALEPLEDDHTIDGFDAQAMFAPAEETQKTRLAVRDALDLPSRRAALADALTESGFDIAACAPALDAFAHPSRAIVRRDARDIPELAWISSRHLAKDGEDTIAATYVRATGDAAKDARALAAIRAADPNAYVTGYAHLERSLKDSLARDLPRVALVSLGVAAVALMLALKSARDAAIALATVVLELAAVAIATRVLHVSWHVYDALVVPVLIGITLDESMFLLAAARARQGDALSKQGPLVACTALTTTAGFVALLACRFDGLRDLGAVGALGAFFGLATALIVVPASLRLTSVSKTPEG
jgi:predicted exporter